MKDEFGSCKCSTWCRAESQPLSDKHHKNCPEYTKKIRVVKITHNGGSYFDHDINNALLSLAEGDDYTYQVQLMEMMQGEYDRLPEFEGF
jgi:hypothetical protein